jgi:hypothetical protein
MIAPDWQDGRCARVPNVVMSSSSTSRRQFLARSATAAAAFGFPAIVHSRSPNAKLNVVFIGVGKRDRAVRREFRESGSCAAVFPGAQKFRDFRKLYDTLKAV